MHVLCLIAPSPPASSLTLRPAPAPSRSIELFDDGLGGDDVAGDAKYTRSCLSICPGVLTAHGVLEECINCGGGGEKLLGILSASLRGRIQVHTLADKSPIKHPGCDTVTFTSHAIFAVCPALMPTYPKVNAWAVQAPNSCVPCRKAFDHFGEAFDFFSLRGARRPRARARARIRARASLGVG